MIWAHFLWLEVVLALFGLAKGPNWGPWGVDPAFVSVFPRLPLAQIFVKVWTCDWKLSLDFGVVSLFSAGSFCHRVVH